MNNLSFQTLDILFKALDLYIKTLHQDNQGTDPQAPAEPDRNNQIQRAEGIRADVYTLRSRKEKEILF